LDFNIFMHFQHSHIVYIVAGDSVLFAQKIFVSLMNGVVAREKFFFSNLLH
jgi:hypothetical protein